ncbi:MAG: hypothetical protein K2X71_26075 [Methylobacterium sp.]|uniref:hypothetical protein n=1 Tax=Methylobacterium sp. TaxID=409 RepID=UPI00258F1406|nr:hypothetical protein [Methylobacterium sp.]MBY0299458.1 hypothetical protein [Methylobacterium sp.]
MTAHVSPFLSAAGIMLVCAVVRAVQLQARDRSPALLSVALLLLATVVAALTVRDAPRKALVEPDEVSFTDVL